MNTNKTMESGEDVLPSFKPVTAMDVIEPGIAGDPLLSNVELPLRSIFHPLGFSIEVITNSEEVLAAAEASWGGLCKVFPEPALELRIALGEGRSGHCPPAPVYRGQKHLLSIVADAGNFGVCDRDRGFAFAWIDRDTVERKEYLRYHFLEAIALSMLASSYVTPLHGACIELDGKGVLLCGNSGAGKSSLAFACARAGWRYISDDASYLVRSGGGRVVVGNSHQVRFRPSAIELFPELEGLSLTPRANDKPSIEVATALIPDVTTARQARVEYIIFLNRGEADRTELVPFPEELAMQWASQSQPDTGANDELKAAIRDLLNAQLFELRYRTLDRAVAKLENLVRAR
jgi:HPr Serine kinase C-terminal domain